jgi:Zn finger protein HypA/HybF involved in hydrogenase expression
MPVRLVMLETSGRPATQETQAIMVSLGQVEQRERPALQAMLEVLVTQVILETQDLMALAGLAV